MRVIAGRLRSRVLKSLPGNKVRPTPDRLRESLFNILAADVGGAVFLDAYAGSGAVGIEALSRGAARAIFIESNHGALCVIRENLAALNLSSAAQIIAGKAANVIAKYPADIVFIDPPYPLEREYRACMEALGDEPAPLVIVQHAVRFELAPEWGKLRRTRTVKQGDNALSFFKPA
jgi:16S rRNA (guanine966-N2)-methyltransferase